MVNFKVGRCGDVGFCLDGEIVGDLHGILDGVKPEFIWEEMFSEVISGYVADVTPVRF